MRLQAEDAKRQAIEDGKVQQQFGANKLNANLRADNERKERERMTNEQKDREMKDRELVQLAQEE